MTFDVIIIGAGPGGLACAKTTSSSGLKTLVLERKQIVGKKVCAGGITWNGLVKRIHDDISERQFNTQYIFSRYQEARISAPTPIIATVNREKLGHLMCQEAQFAGAEVMFGCQLISISGNTITFLDKTSKQLKQKHFSYLVGADGSSSFVRRYLQLPVSHLGVGINYQLAGNYPQMEWHLDSTLFSSGYSWVFPHKDTVSIGAYVDARAMKAKVLKENLIKWGEKSGHSFSGYQGQAEYINYDYRGYRFNNIFLVGDAAGLASGLTGEGIYPAIVSGETVGKSIIDPLFNPVDLKNIVKNNSRHRRMVSFLGKNKFYSTVLAELVTFCLKKKVLKFNVAEMAH